MEYIIHADDQNVKQRWRNRQAPNDGNSNRSRDSSSQMSYKEIHPSFHQEYSIWWNIKKSQIHFEIIL